MDRLVLSVGRAQSEHAIEREKWNEYGLTIDFADTIEQAAQKLAGQKYVCVVICSDSIPDSDLFVLRKLRPVPILVLPPCYSAGQRYACIHSSIMQYLRAEGLGSKDSLRYDLNIPCQRHEPLTMIAVQDLVFCLEYRTVEVRQQEIDLTAKEFDILALLIMNQRRVLTYEMITGWKDFESSLQGSLQVRLNMEMKSLDAYQSMVDDAVLNVRV